jgi:hypothetical protein
MRKRLISAIPHRRHGRSCGVICLKSTRFEARTGIRALLFFYRTIEQRESLHLSLSLQLLKCSLNCFPIEAMLVFQLVQGNAAFTFWFGFGNSKNLVFDGLIHEAIISPFVKGGETRVVSQAILITEIMRLTRGDKTDAIIVVVIAVGACLVWWFLMKISWKARPERGGSHGRTGGALN